MRKYIALALTALLSACTMSIEPVQQPLPDGIFPNAVEVPELTISLGEDTPATKADFAYTGGQLVGTWSEGDQVAVVVAVSYSDYTYLYQVTNPGSSVGQFSLVSSTNYSSAHYGIFYPGDRIKSDFNFMDWSYEGQVQKKSDPMAHVKKYFSFRKLAESSEYTPRSTDLNLSGASKSACLRMHLTGMTFHSPTKIKVSLSGATFALENYLSPYYNNGTDTYDGLATSSEMTLELDGYSDETSLDAYLMLSNKDITLSAGGKLTLTITCSDGVYYVDVPVNSDITLQGGYCHELNIDSGWVASGGDYTEYPWDGDVVTLQEGRAGLDLVIMGDGFIKQDFDDGTYDQLMRQAYQEFFTVQPYEYFKDWFNVYYVKAVSPERCNATNTGSNGAINSGTVTKFSCEFTENSTHLSGNNDLVNTYAKKAFATDANTRIKNATIIVLANQNCRAGTCSNSWYSDGTDCAASRAIAYCALGRTVKERIQLLHHEAAGHGFGKLADEYTSNQYYPSPSGVWAKMDSYHSLGLFRNVDKYVDADSQTGSYVITDASNVLWSDMFGTSNNYESSSVESLGIFEGAYTVTRDFCRPTEDGSKSIMNKNTGIFNAISRRTIIYRIRHLAGEVTGNKYADTAEYNWFLNWDATYFLPNIATEMARAPKRAPMLAEDEEDYITSPPEYIYGHWEDGNFIPEE